MRLLHIQYMTLCTTIRVCAANYQSVCSQLSECVQPTIRIQDKTMIRLEANNSANLVVYSGSLLHLLLSLTSLYTTVGKGLGKSA